MLEVKPKYSPTQPPRKKISWKLSNFLTQEFKESLISLPSKGNIYRLSDHAYRPTLVGQPQSSAARCFSDCSPWLFTKSYGEPLQISSHLFDSREFVCRQRTLGTDLECLFGWPGGV
ncbi:hypothetical protein TWF569_006693 [Orbilia oligospora]|uniref:Uncharacterized protein n=1 Tax=Orbilia oligospora TaxID=2813651 RepID=A0A7C8NRI7_ORBOL|nr:hypothetical protein TWF102_005265 [Orbilia oligospora]KAF3101852.1 hypothetical protein TWF103_007841 [Orbilia oligospora]KAF3140073.1 hypothetical protein TWF594_006463 [Orbilia oligospora]KAF3145067.1 hypothetical protein TWF569_006693 [Orbilia oligospora]